jgi:hypothetical protein
MQNRKRRPPGFGNRVQISDCDAGASGVVVALLEGEYVSVHLSDCTVPTTHGSHSLEVDFQAQAYEE